MQMQETELGKSINSGMKTLRRLRDEIRLEIHLAGMDAKDAWKKLEPEIHQAERAAHELSRASQELVTGLVERVRIFRDQLPPHD